ncbi:guanitoxin biosynthesis L-arginine gamma (S) hydroxylase [Candidatus Albibeggiatoa sp. nov. NOAA]|uniref:guanitoxin biosynthesis L-arginine gamma (S) hydroxylase n=1 Tax=Candidatus Albibeggiatoa sp. nov. NOAA TaxID=3162724 RepID=UPI0032FF616B|nr:fatty acid desaturase family protein [Thiotrichaceae bacterium]
MRKDITRHKFSDKIKKELKSLLVLDNWHCWLAFIEDVIVVSAAILITIHFSWYFYPLAILMIGSRQRALATILHESAHGAVAKNPTLNYIMGTFLSGYLIFQTMASYKKSHVHEHHAHFGDPEKDPDYKYALSEGLYENHTLSDFRKKFILSPLLLSKVPSYLHSLIVRRLFEEKNYNELFAMLLFWGVIVSALAYAGVAEYLVLFWLVPYLTTFQIIGWFIELSEHYPLMEKDTNIYMSRNRHSHPVELFFTGMHNENYHLIHHLFPTIPFWNLPKAHQVLMQDENYARHDRETGGIVWSNNTNPSILAYAQSQCTQIECKEATSS